MRLQHTLLLAFVVARCFIFADEAPSKPAEIRFVDADGRVLLSRDGVALAVLQIRNAAAEDAASPLVLEAAAAQKALADQGLAALAGEQIRNVDFPLTGGGPKDRMGMLIRGRKVAAGARLLVSSAINGPTLSALQRNWKAPPLELAVQIFADADGKMPEILFIDGEKAAPHFEKVEKRRARAWSFENKKNFRVTLARSAPVQWTVRGRDNSVLMTAPLLPDPRERAEYGSFVLYFGSGADDAPPEISPLKLERREIPAREILEGSVRVYTSGSNPFALAETAVIAEIACPPNPKGEVEIKRLPCFFREAPPSVPAEGEFRFRFAPPAEGVYGVRIAVVTAAGQARGDAESFRAGPPASPGFVKVRENERFLRLDDGRLFVPLGSGEIASSDKGPQVDDIEPYRSQCVDLARRGFNASHVTICSNDLKLEASAGMYDPAVAEKLDDIFRCAQARGIHLIVNIEQARRINEDSKTHPYFREMDGPLSATPEFFRDPAARRFYQNRVTYLAARYGAFRSVLAWELLESIDRSWAILAKDPDDKKLKFNEVDLCRRARRDVQEWAGVMAQHLKGMDQHNHPVCVSTTLDPAKPWLDLERVETLDWILNSSIVLDPQSHRDEAAAIWKWSEALRQKERARKPFSFTRLNCPVSENEQFEDDIDSRVMFRRLTWHNPVFASLASGLASPPLDSYGEDIPAAKIFSAALGELLETQTKDESQFFDSDAAANLHIYGRACSRGIVAWLHDKRSTWGAVFEKQPKPATFKDVEVKLPGLSAGKYSLLWLDTWSGEILRSEIYEAPAAKPPAPLILKSPEFKRDAAFFALPYRPQ